MEKGRAATLEEIAGRVRSFVERMNQPEIANPAAVEAFRAEVFRALGSFEFFLEQLDGTGKGSPQR